MGEFVGVNPDRVRKLANRLKDLEHALSVHGPNIKKKLQEWDTALDLSVIAKQTGAVSDYARNMSKRADLARDLLTHGGSGLCTPAGEIVSIPWNMKDVTDQQRAQEAKDEAADLKNALDDPEALGSREAIEAIGQSVQDHKDDPAYLKAFADAGGMADVARVSQALHQQDGTHKNVVLSDDSAEIIGKFADGINRIFKYERGKNPKIPPNADYEKALTQPAGGDMWSVGMLFKYGPRGDAWEPHVLSHVAGAMLDWRKSHDMRPGYSKGGVVGMGYSPEAYEDPEDAWYGALGLTHSDMDENSQDALSRVNAIDTNDPSIALMQRVSENADAARDLLGGKSGANHAKELVNDGWATPGTKLDDAKFPAAVIRAATGDRIHHAAESATAAANVINAGAAKYAQDGTKSDHEKEQYPVNMAMSKALSNVFQAYVPDFATSTGVSQKHASPADGTVIVDKETAKAFLSEIMKNHDEAGNVIQAINAQIGLTSQHGIDGGAGTYLKNLAELRGEVSAAGHGAHMDEAALRDAEHAKQLLWFNIITSGAAAVPLPENPAKFALGSKWGQAAIWAGIPYGGSEFPSGESSQVESDYKAIKFSDSTSMQVPLMRGLVRSREIKPPDNHPEWADGNIVIDNDKDRNDFNAWWIKAKEHCQGRLDNFDDDMRDAFKRGADN
ncbi:hypothetical protein [Streptomyces natalensis]|uniref:Uncharacterized protein n=1 Tax=Streptomyces natalensis ATCC 27448 TaxID=1240678 RepID=A0A0D7CGN1_9ACTN|nr:hypothetical protein [Streptomyces natalensis]KIZ15424.1 hypothetical protein SNA_28135 [Streptomyces natalensis ATCC 27448]